METSTIIFIITISIGFIFLRWLITPIPHTVPHEIETIRSARRNGRAALENSSQSSLAPSSSARQVTDLMIEVVQAIAPHLTTAQIRYDLERSGSVEATVNNYMENNTLPFPPGTTQEETDHNVAPKVETINLLEKYNLNDDGTFAASGSDVTGNSGTGQWAASKQERTENLMNKRREMILNARKRLASQLANEKDASF